MKKIIIFALAIMATFGLAGCSTNDSIQGYNSTVIDQVDKSQDAVDSFNDSNDALNEMNNTDID